MDSHTNSTFSTQPDIARILAAPWASREHVQDLIKLAMLSRSGSRTRRPRVRKRDPARIPRPMNCFLAYRLEKQKQITECCPGANHRDISKIVAKWWKEESEHEKEKYRDIAKMAKKDHTEKYPGYKYTPKKKKNTLKKPNSDFVSHPSISAQPVSASTAAYVSSSVLSNEESFCSLSYPPSHMIQNNIGTSMAYHEPTLLLGGGGGDGGRFLPMFHDPFMASFWPAPQADAANPPGMGQFQLHDTPLLDFSHSPATAPLENTDSTLACLDYQVPFVEDPSMFSATFQPDLCEGLYNKASHAPSGSCSMVLPLQWNDPHKMFVKPRDLSFPHST